LSPSATIVDKDARMALLQHQYELRKTAILSAIPTITGALTDSLMEGSTLTSTSGAAAAAQGCHSPAPQRRLAIPGQQAAVPGAGVIMGKFEQNIPIQNSGFVDCPIGGNLAPAARQPPLGDFDRTAPVDQEKVAQQGRTCGGEEWVPPSQDLTMTGERTATASAGIAFDVPGTSQWNHSCGHIGDSQEEFGLDVRVGHTMALEQAADQSGRNDVGSDQEEEEEELYLGGLPVTVSPRSARTFNAMSSSRRSAVPLSTERGQPRQKTDDPQGSEDKDEERDQ